VTVDSQPRIPGPVNVAAITPRTGAAYIPDTGAFAELVDFLAAAGAHGIVALGSTGEFPHFSLEDRAKLVAAAAARGRIPVMAAVTHSTLDGTVRLAMPPYYFRYRQAEIREFYLRVADRLRGALPVLLYNIPLFTSAIAIETACELLASGAFAGIKDSSGDPEYFARLNAARRRTPFAILAGADALFARARRQGADGVVSGVASAVPELLAALDRAIQDGDEPRASRLDARLREFLAWLDKFPVPEGVKAAARARGLPSAPPAVPLAEAARRDLDAFRDWFASWLPDTLAAAAPPPDSTLAPLSL
jgi:4-hydroxy-tetrahydrodipicolinate synthase